MQQTVSATLCECQLIAQWYQLILQWDGSASDNVVGCSALIHASSSYPLFPTLSVWFPQHIDAASVAKCVQWALSNYLNIHVISCDCLSLLVISRLHTQYTNNYIENQITFGNHCFTTTRPHLWNSLPSKLRQCDSLWEFKRLLKKHLFRDHGTLWHCS